MFTDVDMPGSMDGLRLAEAVRGRWPPIEIIVTSGHRIVSLEDLPRGSVFVLKPYRERMSWPHFGKWRRDAAHLP